MTTTQQLYKDFPLRTAIAVNLSIAIEHRAKKFEAVGSGPHSLLALHNRNWYTIAHDRDSSILYRMPKAAEQKE